MEVLPTPESPRKTNLNLVSQRLVLSSIVACFFCIFLLLFQKKIIRWQSIAKSHQIFKDIYDGYDVPLSYCFIPFQTVYYKCWCGCSRVPSTPPKINKYNLYWTIISKISMQSPIINPAPSFTSLPITIINCLHSYSIATMKKSRTDCTPIFNQEGSLRDSRRKNPPNRWLINAAGLIWRINREILLSTTLSSGIVSELSKYWNFTRQITPKGIRMDSTVST